MPSTKIVVSGEIQIDPADHDAAIALVEPLVTATRAEAGCIEYDFWVDPRDPGRIRVFEEWTSDKPIEAHSESDHYIQFLTAIAGIRVKSVELWRFDVTSKSPHSP
ncbi:MAG TPA: putative quinol monooxygenase [Acidimicrobiia bacterium]|nr:putative quinol monooxygenase [Acidimicrobiia bacterium]